MSERETEVGTVSRPPIVVLHIFGRMDRGGAELRTVDLVRRLPPGRFEMIFGTLAGEEGALAAEIRSLGASVVPLGLGPKGILRLWKLLRARRVDVVHSHVATFSGLVLLLARIAGVQGRIAHFRSDADRHGNSIRRRLQRRTMRTLLRQFATDIVAVSPAALDFALPSGPGTRARTVVLPSGLETEEFHAVLRDESGGVWTVEDGVRRVLHVGRSSPEKNRSRAIGILGALQELGVPAELVMVGRMSDDERDNLTRLGDNLRDRKALRFVGERGDVPDWIARADVLLVTSTREGLPGVVLEATALGTPVVGSEIPGISWLERQFDSIRSVGLDQPDQVWAKALDEVMLQPPSLRSRRVALSEFEASPFALRHAVVAFQELWVVAARNG